MYGTENLKVTFCLNVVIKAVWDFNRGMWKHNKFNRFLRITFMKDLCLFLLHLVLSGGCVEDPGLLRCYAVSIGKVTGTVGLDCLILQKKALRSIEEPVILHHSPCCNIPHDLDLILYSWAHGRLQCLDTRHLAQYLHLSVNAPECFGFNRWQSSGSVLACAACVSTYAKRKLHMIK
jgi:hypothetical protein